MPYARDALRADIGAGALQAAPDISIRQSRPEVQWRDDFGLRDP